MVLIKENSVTSNSFISNYLYLIIIALASFIFGQNINKEDQYNKSRHLDKFFEKEYIEKEYTENEQNRSTSYINIFTNIFAIFFSD